MKDLRLDLHRHFRGGEVALANSQIHRTKPNEPAQTRDHGTEKTRAVQHESRPRPSSARCSSCRNKHTRAAGESSVGSTTESQQVERSELNGYKAAAVYSKVHAGDEVGVPWPGRMLPLHVVSE
jgi:hypothetical protein